MGSSYAFHVSAPLDHQELMLQAEKLSEEYPFLSFSYLCESILGKGIPIFSIGQGEKEILYIGAHHGMEWITSVILLRFVYDFCEYLKEEKTIYRTSLPLLCEQYTLHIIPMLNPDGVDYQIHGVSSDNPLYERVIKMNHNSSDFSHWQANARGVDLNHNYDANFWKYKELEKQAEIFDGAPSRYSGEEPESEPEVGHLCNFIRFHDGLRMILTLHTQGEEIFYQSHGKCPAKSHSVARRISALSGYRLSQAEGLASYGGLTDWCISNMNLPAFTIECGRGKNPLPLCNYFPIYATLREVLFTIPKMF